MTSGRPARILSAILTVCSHAAAERVDTPKFAAAAKLSWLMPRVISAIFGRRPQAVVLLLTVLCWSPYFARRIVPFHDSAEQYQRFHSFYSELLFNHDLLRWYPNVDFGVPAVFIRTRSIRPAMW